MDLQVPERREKYGLQQNAEIVYTAGNDIAAYLRTASSVDGINGTFVMIFNLLQLPGVPLTTAGR